MMQTKKERYSKVLSKYVPKEFIELTVELLLKHPVVFKIVKPRKTKLGDFRAGMKTEKHQITVNGDLNKYSFLITTLHEFAHLITYNEFGRKAAPHGHEWKSNFRELLLPIINSSSLPKPIENALVNSLTNVKASSCTDINLQRVLITYNEQTDDLKTLETLNKKSTFELNGKHFEKGILRRTRFLCMEKETRKNYLVNRLALVKEIKNEE